MSTTSTTAHTITHLPKAQWDAFFLGLWPYYQVDVASLKSTFIKPLGRDGDSYFGLWLISKDESVCPVVRICTQKENTHVVANNLSDFLLPVEDRVIDPRFCDRHLRAFLDCFKD